MRGIAMHHDTRTPAPIADSPEDVTTRTIPLDGGTAIVEHVEDRVELTIRLGERIVCGLALSPLEAAAIGRALHSPDGATTGDLFHLADAMHADASALAKHWGTARDPLTAHLALLDERARLALAVLEGDDAMPLLESLGIEDTADTGEQVAEDYLHSGYPFTPAPGTATVAVLAAGGPEIHLARHGDGYALTGYMPGHRDAVRTSPAITAWGRLRDDAQAV